MSRSILICDDEPDIRTAMRRTLRAYEVAEVGSTGEAIDILKTREFDAIISDYSLGTDENGLDLLQHIRIAYPEMVRFLVTGNKVLEVVVRAVNEGAVHQYFQKPWDDQKLRAALEIALAAQHG